MESQFQIMLTRGPEPHPTEPLKAVIVTRYESRWMVNGVPQPNTDHAILISTLKQALEMAIANAPYAPPTILIADGPLPTPTGH